MSRFTAPLVILLGLALFSVFADGLSTSISDDVGDISGWFGIGTWLQELLPGENGAGLLVGALIIMFAYGGRFNKLVRQEDLPEGFPSFDAWSFTTRLNYWMGKVIYVGIGLTILGLCYYLPDVVLQIACAVDAAASSDFCGTTVDGERFLKAYPEAGLAEARSVGALAFGVFLPIFLLHVPVIEPRLRAAMHNVALIPDRAQELYDALSGEAARDRFQLDKDMRTAFLDDYGADAGAGTKRDRPYLHQCDFVPGLRDEGYLEIYPRIEFFLWRIDNVDEEERRKFGVGRFNRDIAAVRREMASLRSDILKVSNVIERNFCEPFPDDVARLHDARGVHPDPASGEPSVTVLDNILHWAKDNEEKVGTGQPRVSMAQKDLAEASLVTLANLGKRCEALHTTLIRLIVLMALHSANTPRRRLAKFGLHGSVDRLEFEIVPVLILMMFGLSVATSLGLAFLRSEFQTVQLSVMVHAFVMPTAAMVGAYMLAAFRGPKKSKRFKEKHEGQKRGSRAASNVEVALTLVAGLLASFAAVNALPRVLWSMEDPVSEASYYTPVVALYGAYVAYAFFRQMDGVPVFKIKDLAWMAGGSAVMGFVSAILHRAVPASGTIAEFDLTAVLREDPAYLVIIGGTAAIFGLAFCLFMYFVNRRQAKARGGDPVAVAAEQRGALEDAPENPVTP